MSRRVGFVVIMAVASVVGDLAAQEAPGSDPAAREEADQIMSDWIEARRAHADSRRLSAATLFLDDSERSELVLLSTMPDPISATVEILSATGRRLLSSEQTIEPQQHLRVDLHALLTPLRKDLPPTASLRVSYHGDDRTLSGWIIHHRGTQVVETQLKKAEYGAGGEEISFFDTRAARTARPAYFLANHAEVPSRYRLRFATGPRSSRRHSMTSEGIVPPGQQIDLSALFERSDRGWLLLEHLDSPENLVLHGFLTGRNHLSSLPVLDAGAIAAEYHALRLPAPQASSSTTLTLFRPGDGSAPGSEVSIELIETETGSLVRRLDVPLPAEEVRTVQIEHLAKAAGIDELSLRVTSDQPFAISGLHRSASRTWSELAMVAESSGHDTGNYPLPDTLRHRVFTTLLNLGPLAAEAVFQIYWPGGTYSYGPITIPAGASRRVDIGELQAANTPDLLGRTLPDRIEHGLIRWTSVGAASIAARTEAVDLASGDLYGFNCKSCCEQLPFAAIIPEVVEFAAGGSATFQSSYYYSTCDGQMGPFPIPPQVQHVPSPFQWNGLTLSANEAADADIGFEAEVFGRSPFCFSFWRWISKWGKGLLCKKTFLDPWSNSQACTVQTSNQQSCLVCCTAQKAYRICRGAHPAITESEYNACVGLCVSE
jgi:hypothetical protein